MKKFIVLVLFICLFLITYTYQDEIYNVYMSFIRLWADKHPAYIPYGGCNDLRLRTYPSGGIPA